MLYLIVFFLVAFDKHSDAENAHTILSFVFPGYGIFGSLSYLIYTRKKIQNAAESVGTSSGESVLTYWNWKSNVPVVGLAVSSVVFVVNEEENSIFVSIN